jgi:hypothetical protein
MDSSHRQDGVNIVLFFFSLGRHTKKKDKDKPMRWVSWSGVVWLLSMVFLALLIYDMWTTMQVLHEQPLYQDRMQRHTQPVHTYLHEQVIMIYERSDVRTQIENIRSVTRTPLYIWSLYPRSQCTLSEAELGEYTWHHVHVLPHSLWDLVKLIPARRIVYLSSQTFLCQDPDRLWTFSESVFWWRPHVLPSPTTLQTTEPIHWYMLLDCMFLNRELEHAALSSMDWVMKSVVEGVICDFEMADIAWTQSSAHVRWGETHVWKDDRETGMFLTLSKTPVALVGQESMQFPEISPLELSVHTPLTASVDILWTPENTTQKAPVVFRCKDRWFVSGADSSDSEANPKPSRLKRVVQDTDTDAEADRSVVQV